MIEGYRKILKRALHSLANKLTTVSANAKFLRDQKGVRGESHEAAVDILDAATSAHVEIAELRKTVERDLPFDERETPTEPLAVVDG